MIGQGASIERGFRLFPVLAVECGGPYVEPMSFVEAAQVDADPIGVGSRPIEAFDAAGRAEDVFRLSAAKAVGACFVPAIGQAEAAFWYDQVKIAGHRADGAVAVEHFDLCRGKVGLELYKPAVTSTGYGDGHENCPFLLTHIRYCPQPMPARLSLHKGGWPLRFRDGRPRSRRAPLLNG